jgi:hypothetical protein
MRETLYTVNVSGDNAAGEIRFEHTRMEACDGLNRKQESDLRHPS